MTLRRDVVSNPVFRFLDAKGRGREVRVLVEELVVRVLLLADEIDTRFWRFVIEVGVDRLEVF